jgi:prepilin-type N-terminal cleavage/methylation domain-containing protein/prepilin-type processing-associated H-X9-DG protein
MTTTIRAFRQGFTLLEILVVLAIVGMLAAILLPIFASAREKARQSSCLSNEKQLGLAVTQYLQDNEETYPNGIQQNGSERIWQGEGWAGQCSTYIKNAGVFRCPSDSSFSSLKSDFPVSYGYNINLVKPPDADDWDEDYPTQLSGLTTSDLSASAKTVLLFEVSSVFANILDDREGAKPGGTVATNFSASGNGLDHRLYAQKTFTTSSFNQYATGYLGGRVPPDTSDTQFLSSSGRHILGSNYLLADGHAHWLMGSQVSSGMDATAENCSQDDIPATASCSGPFTAAGTGFAAGNTAATFSTE